ncbi:MAG: MATE family efflux transporter, partial [Acidobacteria bacterium]|nr:MATE family efflux transporter [Candidatus Sulfomarinibacter kjeldsenii]
MTHPFELPTRRDLDAMMRLALPVVVVQVGMMLIGVVDTMVVGRLSSEALAAVALGHVMLMAVYSFGIGLLLALDPLVSQAVGAGD